MINERELVVLVAVPVTRTGTIAGSGQLCYFDVRNSQTGISPPPHPCWISVRALLCWAGFGLTEKMSSVPLGQVCPSGLWPVLLFGSTSHLVKLEQVLHSGVVVSTQRPNIIGKTRSWIQVTMTSAQNSKERKEKPESKWSLFVGLSQETMNHQRGSRVTTEKYLWRSVVQRANNTNIIKKRKEGIPEIKEASR